MIIESKKVLVNQKIQEVFDFLKDTNNIQSLLPEDKITDWNSDTTSCSFKVQGGIVISFVQKRLNQPVEIHMESGEKSPFPFTLIVFLEEKGGQTEGYLKFEADVNMFLKMMIETPLENLFNYMAERLKQHYS